jgi:excisionase family DNA binding protein
MTELPQTILLRPDEVAEYFGVSRQTVYVWLRKNKLTHVHTPGGQVRIAKTEVERVKAIMDLMP